ncbi:hypothetical protein ABBQ32_010108 [Trebouxia sp. C0010 RCD-2024]
MFSTPPADLPMHFGPDLEKENADRDHLPVFRKSAMKQQHGDETAVDHIAARLPLLGLAPGGQETSTLKQSAALDWLQETASPGLLKPTGTCTPVLSPYLKELSSPSPGSSQTSPLTISKLRSTKALVRPVVRRVASASPERYTTLLVEHEQQKAVHKAMSGRPKPCNRSVVRVRARRALTLQSGDESMPFSGDQVSNRRSSCSKSVGDLNLSGARLQSAARANLSRSADWPSSSAASIRKRTVSVSYATLMHPTSCITFSVSCLFPSQPSI